MSGSLRALQIAFHRELLGRPSALAAQVHTDARLPVERRLQIYGHAYRARLRDALRDTFDKTARCAGTAAFDELAAAFARDHPPSHRNLRWYGAHFDRWLAGALPERPELAELAALDWQLRCAFDAADDERHLALTIADLAGVDWVRTGCRFTSTLALLPVRRNAAAIWHALEVDDVPPAAAALAQPGFVLVWRRSWQACFRTIAADEQALLVALRGGRPLAAVCAERGAKGSAERGAKGSAANGAGGAAAAAALATTCLPQWIGDELVVAFTAH